jgi:hypothetical protein
MMWQPTSGLDILSIVPLSSQSIMIEERMIDPRRSIAIEASGEGAQIASHAS